MSLCLFVIVFVIYSQKLTAVTFKHFGKMKAHRKCLNDHGSYCVGITVMDRIYYVEGITDEGGKICGEALYGSGRQACGDRCRDGFSAAEISGRAGGLLLAVWAMTTPETACWRNWNPWG